jgi:hypothetical protein
MFLHRSCPGLFLLRQKKKPSPPRCFVERTMVSAPSTPSLAPKPTDSLTKTKGAPDAPETGSDVALHPQQQQHQQQYQQPTGIPHGRFRALLLFPFLLRTTDRPLLLLDLCLLDSRLLDFSFWEPSISRVKHTGTQGAHKFSIPFPLLLSLRPPCLLPSIPLSFFVGACAVCIALQTKNMTLITFSLLM